MTWKLVVSYFRKYEDYLELFKHALEMVGELLVDYLEIILGAFGHKLKTIWILLGESANAFGIFFGGGFG